MIQIILLFLLFFSVKVNADIYKCTDSEGKKFYRSAPCNEGYSNVLIDLKTGKSIDLDEENRRQMERLKEQQQKVDQQKLQRAQENLKKLQIENESKKNQLLIKNNPDKYSAFAIPPYDISSLTPLLKRYESRMQDIERLRGVASQKALLSGQCSRVESSDLSEKSGKSLVFLVYCSNAKNFYFDEKELD